MNKSVILVGLAISILAFTAFRSTNAGESQNESTKSVAWYVANIKEARKQNQLCHDDPGIQTSENCLNSLHALEITFKGGN